jgi:nucleolar protein 12
MDYNTDQNDLWIFFEKLVEGERGAPRDGKQWVVDVRIIRDKDTQMGKGFGYVAFSVCTMRIKWMHLLTYSQDAECVDEVLALSAEKLKYAKRTLRVQRSKVLPPSLGGKEAKKQAAAAASGARGKDGKPVRSAPVKKAAPLPTIPKGDPTLGAKIANLSKDERKVAKSSDPDRLARRMAKKAVVKAKLKAGDAVAGSREKVKLDMKGGGKKGKEGGKLKAKKSRVRSEHALKKMKGKRD